MRAHADSDWMILANCRVGLGYKLEAFVGKIIVRCCLNYFLDSVTHFIYFVSGKLRPCCRECSIVFWKVMDCVHCLLFSIQNYGLLWRGFFVTPSSLVGWQRRFRRTSCLHLQGWRNWVKVCSPEMLVCGYKTSKFSIFLSDGVI